MTETPNLTKNQSLVFKALRAAEGPLSAYAILDRLRQEGLRAPLQVYRALDKLLDYGLVHRLESLNAFVACNHPHADEQGMTAFAICETCGDVVEFSDEMVRERLGAWATTNRFSAARITVEIRGTCSRCAASAPGAAATGGGRRGN
jgi:Fur family transcriptional regulator, zinc uptake regulator